MRAFRLIGRSLQSDDLSSGSPPSANLSALRNSCPSFHLEIYVYNYTYILASTKCSTWNTFPICSLSHPAAITISGPSRSFYETSCVYSVRARARYDVWPSRASEEQSNSDVANGVQTDFLNAGQATILGNSIIEGDNAGNPQLMKKASCITCHDLSTINKQGQSMGPDFIVGVPTIKPGYVTRDFVWSLSLFRYTHWRWHGHQLQSLPSRSGE